MTRSQRIHGSISETYNEKTTEIFEVYSLIDITVTGTVAPYNPKIKQFIDDSDTIVNGETSWNKSRNKQRNWETIVQVIGLRCLPIIVQTPIVVYGNLDQYEFGDYYKNKSNIWIFRFATEQQELFKGNNSNTELLDFDLHQVPIITNLDETVNIQPSIIDTQSLNKKNLYTKLIQVVNE